MANFPHMPLWTDAYMADCAHLSFEEHGVYLVLLMKIWRAPNCQVPNDMKWIQRHLNASDDQMKNLVKPLVAEFFDTTGNWVTQKRLKAEYEWVQKRTGKQRAAAKSRWDKEKLACERKASIPIPIPIPIPIDSNPPIIPPRKRKPKKVPLPQNWEPNDHAKQIAEELNYDEKERKLILDEFINSAEANGRTYANWDAAFYNWLRSEFTIRKIQQYRRNNNITSIHSNRRNSGDIVTAVGQFIARGSS